MLIDRLNAERQYGPRTRGSPFETLNAVSKCRENRKGSGRAHVLVQLIGEMICSLFVLFMLRSQLESESRRDERLIKAGAASHVLCAKQETWLIELSIPLLIRNLCPSPILKSSIPNSDGRSNTAFAKT